MLRRPLFLALALCLLAIPAQAEDDCTLSLDAIKPVMGGKAQKDDDNRRLVETITMKDGIEASYTVGGCAHYAFSFGFKNIDTAKDLPEQAIVLLKALPVTDALNRDTAVKILEDAQQKKIRAPQMNEGFACGDAWCRLWTESGTLNFAYDFPL